MQRYRDIAIIVLCIMLAGCAWSVTQSVNRLSLAGAEAVDAAKGDEGALSVQLADQIDRLGSQSSDALAKVSHVADSTSSFLRVTSKSLNAPCEPAPCGTLADINRTLATTRGTLGTVELAGRDFDRHSSQFYAQEAAGAADFQQTVGDIDRFVTAPDLLGTMHHLDTASLAVSATAQNLDAVSTDGRTWIHERLFPTKKRGIISGIEATGDVVHHWLPPLF